MSKKKQKSKGSVLRKFNKATGIILLIDGILTSLLAALVYFSLYQFKLAIYLFLLDAVLAVPFIVVGILILKDDLKDMKKSLKRVAGMLIFIFFLLALFIFRNNIPPILHILSFIVLVIELVLMRRKN
jgi:amino acid transporter